MPTSWHTTWRWLIGLAVCGSFGWIAFVRVERIPLLGFADLGFHELGHLVMYLFPIHELLTAAMGSIFQVAIPLGLAAYFWLKRGDRFAAALMAAWAAASSRDVAVYAADAPYQRLPLLGGDNVTHDWAFILGRLDALDRADAVAGLITVTGLLMLLAAAVVCGFGLWDGLAGIVRKERRAERLARLPVREARYRRHTSA